MTSPQDFEKLAQDYISSPELPARAGETLNSKQPKITVDRDRRSRPQERLDQSGISNMPTRSPLSMELLFLGNLPVYAPNWGHEYTRQVAAEEGPVALIRLSYKSCSVQIFGGRAGSIDLPDGFSKQMGEIAAWISDHVNRVLIMPRQLDDDELILETELPITIISGGDDVAKIEAYRRSKQFVEVARSQELPFPQAALVIAGTRESDAQVFASRIHETTTRFLDLKLPLKRIIPTIGSDPSGASAGAVHDVSVGPDYDTLHLIADLQRATRALASEVVDDPSESLELKPTEPAPVAPTAEASEQVFSSILNGEFDDDEAVSDREVREILDPSSPVQVSDPVELEPQEHSEQKQLEQDLQSIEASFDNDAAVVSEPILEPEPEPQSAAYAAAVAEPLTTTLVVEDEAETPDSRGMRYSSLIPGLTPMNFECLDEPSIELAFDDSRRLHLVALESSVSKLRNAENWAIRYRTYLNALAPDGLAPFGDHGLVSNLLVEDAANASVHQKTGILLHLLEGAPDNRRTRPLNNEQSAFGGS